MKAIMVNEDQGGFQQLTGFDRVKEKRLGGNAMSNYWDKVLGEIMDKLGGKGTSEGCDIFVGVVGGGVGCYPLYKTKDAAAFGWASAYAVLGKGTSVEYSGQIYEISFDGKTKYYGYTLAVRFSDSPKAKIKSPGPYDELHKMPKGATVVGYIHIHHTDSDPESEFFSKGTYDSNGKWEPRDEGLITDNSSLHFYLVTNNGNLRVHRPEGYFEKAYQPIIAKNFYGYEKIPGSQARTSKGEMIMDLKGNVPYPDFEGGHLNIDIRRYEDFLPVLYLDFPSGKPYGLDNKPLKK